MSKKKNLEKSDKKESYKNNQICFVISPIGKEETETYLKFKEVLDYLIKPAVESFGYTLEIVRADDIEKAGSFIIDILNNLVSSFVVIADLTDQNPNVFYELGVRHSFSSRTILISQYLDDIPSDLREYRTIIYDTSAKGLSLFKAKIKKYLKEIYDEPERPDNPVLDRIGGIMETQKTKYQEEISSLKIQIKNFLSGSDQNKLAIKTESIKTRVNRILKLVNADHQDLFGGEFIIENTKGEEKSYKLPPEQGNFELYFIMEEKIIADYWYLSIIENSVNIDEELADIRVLMENSSAGQNVDIKFILATNDDLLDRKERIQNAFNKMKSFISAESRKYFKFLIWDKYGMIEEEKKLGLKVKV